MPWLVAAGCSAERLRRSIAGLTAMNVSSPSEGKPSTSMPRGRNKLQPAHRLPCQPGWSRPRPVQSPSLSVSINLHSLRALPRCNLPGARPRKRARMKPPQSSRWGSSRVSMFAAKSRPSGQDSDDGTGRSPTRVFIVFQTRQEMTAAAMDFPGEKFGQPRGNRLESEAATT